MFPQINFKLPLRKTAIPNFIIIALESERTGCGSTSGCFAPDGLFVSSSDERREVSRSEVRGLYSSSPLIHTERQVEANFDDAVFVGTCFFGFILFWLDAFAGGLRNTNKSNNFIKEIDNAV